VDLILFNILKTPTIDINAENHDYIDLISSNANSDRFEIQAMIDIYPEVL